MKDIVSIFKFLEEYNKLLNPVTRDVNDQVEYKKLSDLPEMEEIKSALRGECRSKKTILSVKRSSAMIKNPIPPESIKDWLVPKWDENTIENISFRQENIAKANNDFDEIISFFDDEQRMKGFDKWSDERNKWIELEKKKRSCNELYDYLFMIHRKIENEKEKFELVIGEGLLRWDLDKVSINHPFFLQPVQLDFDPEKPEFTISFQEEQEEEIKPIAGYMNLLQKIESANQEAIVENIKEYEGTVLDSEEMEKLCQKVVHNLDSKGEFCGTEEEKPLSKSPIIYLNPMLILRKRNQGYTHFMERATSKIEKTDVEDLPPFVKAIVGEYEEIISEEGEKGKPAEQFLTLATNKEQIKIIDRLENHGAVLVQGPPGTGKTHTIANIIGHLLSKGENVLVTSQTEKALSVLKEKVYKSDVNEVNLQELCISLLSGQKERAEMDGVIRTIMERKTNDDLEELESKISKIKEEREKLKEEKREKEQTLLKERNKEYEDITFDGKTISPIEAAKFVGEGRGKYDYIAGKTKDNTVGLPIEYEDLCSLYASNGKLTKKEENFLDGEIIKIKEILWDKEKIEYNISMRTKLKDNKNLKQDFHFAENETVEDGFKRGSALKLEIENIDDWQLKIINKSLRDENYSHIWGEIIADFDKYNEETLKIEKILLDNRYDFDDTMINWESIAILREIVGQNKAKPINGVTLLLRPKWKRIAEGIRKDGLKIEHIEDYQNVLNLFLFKEKEKKLEKNIMNHMDSISIKEEHFIEFLKKNKEELIESVAWNTEKWRPFVTELDKIRNPQGGKIKSNCNGEKIEKYIKSITDSLNITREKMQVEALEKEKAEYIHMLLQLNKEKKHHLIEKLITSVKQDDYKSYVSVYQDVKDIIGKLEMFSKRKNILNEIQKIAPMWAEELRNQKDIHGRTSVPEDIEKAWKWTQLNNQLEELNRINFMDVQNELQNTEEKLLRKTRELSYTLAWKKQLEQLTPEQSTALNVWQTTIKKIGKGKGKRVAEYRREAMNQTKICQSAIPVWIMPMYKVVENFDPFDNTFDVIIIDEASQSSMTSLPILLMGKKIIIVGDDEQVSPDAPVGNKTEDIKALQDTYLKDVPNNYLYDRELSLYDIAKQLNFKTVMLKEHFRCVPDIIGFSNEISYNGEIEPLKDVTSSYIRPATVDFKVPNGIREGDKNIEEAEYIVSFIKAMTQMEEYENKTIGVMSLHKNYQSEEIDRMLNEYIDPIEYKKREIRCGMPKDFQGDERDIIFLSVVDSPKRGGGPITLKSLEGNNSAAKKKYNVAASRAKEQLWVVHSLNIETDLKTEDIRYKLIKYMETHPSSREVIEKRKAESVFESAVMDNLFKRGYQIEAQRSVGAYRLDMVIIDGENKVALECDGEKYHRDEDFLHDSDRQAQLERVGWRFIRLRGSEYYRNPQMAMERVVKELEKKNIFPTNQQEKDMFQADLKETPLLKKVKNEARKIREDIKIKVADKENLRSNFLMEAEKKGETKSSASEIVGDKIKESTILISQKKSSPNSQREKLKTNRRKSQKETIESQKAIASYNGIREEKNDTKSALKEDRKGEYMFDFTDGN